MWCPVLKRCWSPCDWPRTLAEGGCATHVCPVLDEQLGTGQVALQAGSVQGGEPVHSAQVHTRTLQTAPAPPEVWLYNRLTCKSFLLSTALLYEHARAADGRGTTALTCPMSLWRARTCPLKAASWMGDQSDSTSGCRRERQQAELSGRMSFSKNINASK